MTMKKKVWRILIILLIFLAVLAGGFLIYASVYYHADSTATAFLQNDRTIETDGNLIILPAENEKDTGTGFIFYPGAKVEASAYLPILEKIREECGVTCVLVKMPLNMAIFNENAADEAMEKLPDIKEWYVGGHSMGGAISSAYAAGHPEKVKGLILMGAYLYGDYPGDRTLVIYGSLNVSVEKHLKGTEHVVRIEGGNHAQFGNYGVQRGDAAAVISREEQQKSAVEAVKGFIKTEP